MSDDFMIWGLEAMRQAGFPVAGVHDLKHGDATTYRKHGCRCDKCTASHREAMRLYRGSKTKANVAIPPGAYQKAVRRLVERHPEEFQRLLEDEIADGTYD